MSSTTSKMKSSFAVLNTNPLNRFVFTFYRSARSLTLFSLFTSIDARLHNFLIFTKSPSSAAQRSALKTKSSLSWKNETRKRFESRRISNRFTSAWDLIELFPSILSRLIADEMDVRRNCDWKKRFIDRPEFGEKSKWTNLFKNFVTQADRFHTLLKRSKSKRRCSVSSWNNTSKLDSLMLDKQTRNNEN